MTYVRLRLQYLLCNQHLLSLDLHTPPVTREMIDISVASVLLVAGLPWSIYKTVPSCPGV